MGVQGGLWFSTMDSGQQDQGDAEGAQERLCALAYSLLRRDIMLINILFLS